MMETCSRLHNIMSIQIFHIKFQPEKEGKGYIYIYTMCSVISNGIA